MKNNIFKFLSVVILIFICLVLYLTRPNKLKHDIIDITGNNGVWSADLNINVGYNTTLVIAPSTDKFELPPDIFIDVLVKGESIYTDNIKIAKNKNFPKYGTYKCRFKSDKYLVKNFKDVSIIVSYSDVTSKVELTMISYP